MAHSVTTSHHILLAILLIATHLCRHFSLVPSFAMRRTAPLTTFSPSKSSTSSLSNYNNSYRQNHSHPYSATSSGSASSPSLSPSPSPYRSSSTSTSSSSRSHLSSSNRIPSSSPQSQYGKVSSASSSSSTFSSSLSSSLPSSFPYYSHNGRSKVLSSSPPLPSPYSASTSSSSSLPPNLNVSPSILPFLSSTTFDSLQSSYDSRLQSLHSTLNSFIISLSHDPTLPTLLSDSVSSPFFIRRIEEIFTAFLQGDQEKNISKLMKKLSEMTEEFQLLKRENEQLAVDFSSLKAENQKEKEQSTLLSDDKNHFSSQYENLLNQYENAIRTIDEINLQREEEKKTLLSLQSLQYEYKGERERADSLQDELYSLRQQLSDISSQLQSTHISYQNEQNENKSKSDKLLLEMQNISSQNEKLRRKSTIHIAENTKLKEENDKMKLQIYEIKDFYRSLTQYHSVPQQQNYNSNHSTEIKEMLREFQTNYIHKELFNGKVEEKVSELQRIKSLISYEKYLNDMEKMENEFHNERKEWGRRMEHSENEKKREFDRRVSAETSLNKFKFLLSLVYKQFLIPLRKMKSHYKKFTQRINMELDTFQLHLNKEIPKILIPSVKHLHLSHSALLSQSSVLRSQLDQNVNILSFYSSLPPQIQMNLGRILSSINEFIPIDSHTQQQLLLSTDPAIYRGEMDGVSVDHDEQERLKGEFREGVETLHQSIQNHHEEFQSSLSEYEKSFVSLQHDHSQLTISHQQLQREKEEILLQNELDKMRLFDEINGESKRKEDEIKQNFNRKIQNLNSQIDELNVKLEEKTKDFEGKIVLIREENERKEELEKVVRKVEERRKSMGTIHINQEGQAAVTLTVPMSHNQNHNVEEEKSREDIPQPTANGNLYFSSPPSSSSSFPSMDFGVTHGSTNSNSISYASPTSNRRVKVSIHSPTPTSSLSPLVNHQNNNRQSHINSPSRVSVTSPHKISIRTSPPPSSFPPSASSSSSSRSFIPSSTIYNDSSASLSFTSSSRFPSESQSQIQNHHEDVSSLVHRVAESLASTGNVLPIVSVNYYDPNRSNNNQ